MTPAYIAKLGFNPQKTGVGAQNIDSLPLEIYEMVSAKFLIKDSLRSIQLLKKTFLLANMSMKIILGMPFLSLSNVDIKFAKKSEKLT